jgi:hypothetical protein
MDADDRLLVLLDADGCEIGRLTPELAELLAIAPKATAFALALAGVESASIALLITRPYTAH